MKSIKVYITNFEHYPAKENGKYPEKYRGSILFLKDEKRIPQSWCRFFSPDGKISHSFNKSTWDFFKNNTKIEFVPKHISDPGHIDERVFEDIKNAIRKMNKNQLQVLDAYIGYELNILSTCRHCGGSI